MPTFEPSPGVNWDGKNLDDKIRFYKMPVNYDLLETLGIGMIQGRTFSRNFGSDTSGVILNEAAVKIMDLTNPVGKVIYLEGNARKILGVTKNFHFNSLHERIRPFLDADYQQQYASEKLVATLSKYFTALAVIVSCLGLFGLAAFTVEKRIKGIGIGKVMGASRSNIIYLLSADFTQIILVSIMIALPLSYQLADSWLDDFAYRIKLSPLYFIGAALLTLLTAWITIGLQTIRAASINPLICLKGE